MQSIFHIRWIIAIYTHDMLVEQKIQKKGLNLSLIDKLPMKAAITLFSISPKK
jgi:hypothetical protein